MIYLIILFFLIFLSFHYKRNLKDKNYWNFIYLFVFFFIVTFVSLSYNLGEDTKVYSAEYSSWPTLEQFRLYPDFSRYQFGWILFESVCRSITPNFLLFQVIHAIFVNSVIFYMTKKYSKNVFFTILCYFLINFLHFNFEIYRESFAVCFGLLAFDAVNTKKVKFKQWLRCVLFFFVAYEMHISALIAPLLLLGKLKKTPIGMGVLLFLSFFLPIIIKIFNFDIVLSLLLSDDKSSFFNEYYEIQESTANTFGWIVLYLKYLFIPLLLLFVGKKDKSGIIYLVFLFAIFRLMRHTSYSFLRFSNYFAFFYWLSLDRLVRNLRVNKNISFIIVLFLVLFEMYVFDSELLAVDTIGSGQYVYERYFPYETIFDSNNSYL